MKAFLIDSFKREICAIDTDGSIDHLRWLTGADWFSSTSFDIHHDLRLDDTG